MDSVKIIPCVHLTGYALKYDGVVYRSLTNEERYEGWMRSDFRDRRVCRYTNIELIKLDKDTKYLIRPL